MHFEDITPRAFARFWSKVDTSAGINGCWRRSGNHYLGGYAMAYLNERPIPGHRFAFVSILGNPPPHLPWVLHKCPGGSNRWCVNPAHLAPGTPQENAVDRERERIARGEVHARRLHPEYSLRGEQNGNAKLTPDAVLDIKRALVRGVPLAVLGRRHGVVYQCIGSIKRGETWRHLTLPESEAEDAPLP